MSRQQKLFIDTVGQHADATNVPSVQVSRPVRVAEFFAGIGLVRLATQQVGGKVVWANDIEPIKQRIYEENFGCSDFHLGDICDVAGSDIPQVDVATASFPCTDLSLAGARRGLAGAASGLFWEFTRILDEMGTAKPSMVLLENVPGLATSHGGDDLVAAVRRLGELGYWCDVIQVDARWFVPQSRPRLFIVGLREQMSEILVRPDALHPRHLVDFMQANQDLRVQALPFRQPAMPQLSINTIVQKFRSNSPVWWDAERARSFEASLSALQLQRVERLKERKALTWRTAYRRTRDGVPQWEIRADELAGCLRTARGGSSKQAVVQVGRGSMKVRWMTPREYARLQGVPDTFSFESVSPNQALFGFGDAVCVPAFAWVIGRVIEMISSSLAQAS